MNILTSASLVRCLGDEAKFVDKLKVSSASHLSSNIVSLGVLLDECYIIVILLQIKVRLPNDKLVVGKLWKYDYKYNVAVVKTKSFPEFHAAHVHNGVKFNSELFQANLVAIGRCYESGELMASSGTVLYKTSRLDCQELMISTCKITKVFLLSHLSVLGGSTNKVELGI